MAVNSLAFVTTLYLFDNQIKQLLNSNITNFNKFWLFIFFNMTEMFSQYETVDLKTLLILRIIKTPQMFHVNLCSKNGLLVTTEFSITSL